MIKAKFSPSASLANLTIWIYSQISMVLADVNFSMIFVALNSSSWPGCTWVCHLHQKFFIQKILKGHALGALRKQLVWILPKFAIFKLYRVLITYEHCVKCYLIRSSDNSMVLRLFHPYTMKVVKVWNIASNHPGSFYQGVMQAKN